MEVPHETPAVKQQKRLTSVVWNHFERIKNADMLYAVCHHCKKRLCGSSNSGTTHLRNHLLRCLKRSNFDVSQILSAKRKRKEIAFAPSMLGQSTLSTNMKNISYEEGKLKDEFITPMPVNIEPEQRREDMIRISAAKFDQERSHLDLARMIMLHGYPLTMVDHPGFKMFVRNLQPLFEINSSTIETNCMNIFSKEKEKVHETLHRLHGRINLAIDMWGSADSSSDYISVTANYIDEEWRLQKTMLTFVSLGPPYTDDLLSEAVIKSVTSWSIDRKLFSMTFDDCSSREIMGFKIKEWFSQNRPLLKNGELFDTRCIAHLSKSIVQEILGASGGLLHKIRESIKHVTSTEAILGKFNEIAQQVGVNTGRNLTLDCRFQWNTTYTMLEAALGYRAAFSQLLDQDPAYPTPLSETEWEWAAAVSSYMKVLLEFTNVFVGNKGSSPTSNVAFAELCDLHIQLNEWCKSNDEYLNSMALRMKNKFDAYWKKCGLVIAIAAILDPRYKTKLVEYYYLQIYGTDDAPHHVREVCDFLRELFTEYSMGSHLLDNPESALPSSSSNGGDKLEGFDRFLNESLQTQGISSDLEKYLEEPVFPRNYDFNVLNWWKVHTPRYPVLSMMACDVLSIPVSTLGPEVAFSNGGRVLDGNLTSLSPDVREALLCGKNWLKLEAQATSIL